MILLDQVENAIDVFSKFVNCAVDRQEGVEDDNFNEVSAQVPEALAGLAAAVNDLRARLFCDLEDDNEDVDTYRESDDVVGDLPRGLKNQIPRKKKPSPLGFTINLHETDDPDEVNESEI